MHVKLMQVFLPDGVLLHKALEDAVQKIAKEDAQASFRLSTSRQQLALDERPTEQSIWSFSQCFLAEAETLSLLKASATTSAQASTPMKLKQMDAAAGVDSPPKNSTPGGWQRPIHTDGGATMPLLQKRIWVQSRKGLQVVA